MTLAQTLKGALLAALLCVSAAASARVTWLVGQGFPLPPAEVAEQLGQLLGEPVTAVTEGTGFLCAWVNDPEQEAERNKLLKADTLLVSPAVQETEALTFMALRALGAQRDARLARPILVEMRKPRYQMNGLYNAKEALQAARLALNAHCSLLPFSRVWRKVYTDDTFYNGKVPKGTTSEAYILAASMMLAIRGEGAQIPPMGGLHDKVADALLASIAKGFAEREVLTTLAARLPAETLPQRAANKLDVLLYNGSFERALAPWLERIAQADGRELVIHYTTECDLESPLPGLFRATTATPHLPNAACYTRPAFADPTGLEELAHLEEILARDSAKPHWLPFPLAVAAWTRTLTGKPLYEPAEPGSATYLPTAPAAAMFAAMVYLDWTGSVALPEQLSAQETVAMGIGIDVMLSMRLRQREPNAIFCKPLGNQRYSFCLWRRPANKAVLSVAVINRPGLGAEPRTLTFTPSNFFARQSVTLTPVEDDPLLPPPAVTQRQLPGTEGPLLLWKIPAQHLPGQNSGLRALE
ncbi:MAG: hypothetical protein ACI4RT_07320 [Candidatus Spyradenecus sp.]